jgi:hypothetical protein
MFDTLVQKVKANIDEKKKVESEPEKVLIRGWTFSEEFGVCPVRCKYEATIKGVDIELRKDICDRFGKNNLVLSGWKIYLPVNKYVDFQIKLGNDWVTFISTNTLQHESQTIQMLQQAVQTQVAQTQVTQTQVTQTQLTSNMIIDPAPTSTRISLATQLSPISHVFVVDQLYQQPDDVRAFGLSVAKDGAHPPLFRSNSNLKEQFEKIIGRKIRSFEQWQENGQFQVTNRTSPIEYEVNPYQYGGIVFLTPNAPVTSGITLYRSKTSKQPIVDKQQLDSMNKSTDLEAVDIIGNVYNRLILFNTKMIHAISHHFGNDVQDGRLIQRFAFDLD